MFWHYGYLPVLLILHNTKIQNIAASSDKSTKCKTLEASKPVSEMKENEVEEQGLDNYVLQPPGSTKAL